MYSTRNGGGMSLFASAVGPPANAAAEPDDAPTLTTSSSASGAAAIAATAAASHLYTGSSPDSDLGGATGRGHPVRSPCKRQPPSATRRENSPVTTSCHHGGQSGARVARAHAPGTARLPAAPDHQTGAVHAAARRWSIVVR